MAEAKPQKEPSMEEILASIRRIISEDGESGGTAAPAASAPAPAAEAVLELTTEVDTEGNPVIPAEPPKPRAAQPVAESSPAPAPAKQADIDAMDFDAVTPAPAAPPSDVTPLVDAGTANAAAAAFASLSEQVAPSRPGAAGTRSDVAGRTVEELAEDLLRPMLQGWLDENLPTMVERLVKREIERIAQRGTRG